MWRIRKRLPPPGVIGVFDRSHYEDVLVVRVHELVPESVWEARYDIINEFETELVANGTTVLKCFLNLSYDTQRKRLLARLDNPDKHWKFNEADLEERARWDDYQVAFSAMLERCNTPHAPWYVVPSDDKKYRNWAVGELLFETLQELDPQFPRPPLDVPALKARLAPPH
jgi:polyphosphate kinase 2 (PPK2 family)